MNDCILVYDSVRLENRWVKKKYVLLYPSLYQPAKQIGGHKSLENKDLEPSGRADFVVNPYVPKTYEA